MHACTGVEGCAREEFWQIIMICLEPPLLFTPQHSSSKATVIMGCSSQAWRPGYSILGYPTYRVHSQPNRQHPHQMVTKSGGGVVRTSSWCPHHRGEPLPDSRTCTYRGHRTEKTQQKKTQSSRSKQTSTYPGHSAGLHKDGCRFRCVLCVVSRVKADRKGPKRQRSYLPWQVGACVICLQYCTYVVYTYTKLKLGIPSLPSTVYSAIN